MKPVLILQHLSGDGPAYLARWLQREGVPFELRNTQAGQAYPDDIAAYSALAVLGGEMSANDPLPSLRQAERLILQAMGSGRPVIGHCLGGQLMARALGARIVASPAPEVGWQPLEVADCAAARAWFGHLGRQVVFQWHYETFELPVGAQALAGSAACPQQAFTIGPHLAMQFHIEIDDEKLRRWSLAEPQPHATVQSGQAMREGVAVHLAEHQALADRIYRRWLGATSAN